MSSLYGLYQDAHPGFVAKYVAMLEAGGSKHHSELLQPFGLDATQRAFWQKGLKVLEGMIDELEGRDVGWVKAKPQTQHIRGKLPWIALGLRCA